MSGRIHQINLSQGGVPKTPVDSARIEVGGVVGDVQADRRYHGGPEQDLCLYSLELIEELRKDGHSIAPGSAGENLTLTGVDWSTLRRGLRLRFGASLIAEVTHTAPPCHKNAQWFSDGVFQRIDEDVHPGWSRWYARVLEPGDVTPGDTVEVVE